MFVYLIILFLFSILATEFYISHDLALLTDHIRTDLSFISRRYFFKNKFLDFFEISKFYLIFDFRWRLRGRPTYCIVIREDNMRDQQFPELLALLLEIKNLRIDNVKVSLGRMQNFMNSACIEHLDFRY